ncbi:hypothetical protein ACOSQ3_010181 [Xanthoceras sorbifolium]
MGLGFVQARHWSRTNWAIAQSPTILGAPFRTQQSCNTILLIKAQQFQLLTMLHNVFSKNIKPFQTSKTKSRDWENLELKPDNGDSPPFQRLAASLLTSGSTALVAMGFDGYINSSQFDPSSLCNNNSSAVLFPFYRCI